MSSGTPYGQGSATSATVLLSFQGVPYGHYRVQVRCVAVVWTSRPFVLDYSAPEPSFMDKPGSDETVKRVCAGKGMSHRKGEGWC